MRIVFGLVLVVGLGLAGFAVYMVNGYIEGYRTALENERADGPNSVETVRVFVAKEQLAYGQVLTKEQVQLVHWPKNALPEGVFTHIDGENDLFHDEERFVLRAMETFEPVLAVKITEPGQDAGIVSRLGSGYRAFTIEVDVASGVSGFLRPGDRVDVYWTGEIYDDQGRQGVTKLIQQSVTIMAIDQQADEETRGANVARTITVRVTPQQVAALAQAQSTGELSLALVGTNDDTDVGQVAMDQTALLGLTPRPEPTVERAEAPKCAPYAHEKVLR